MQQVNNKILASHDCRVTDIENQTNYQFFESSTNKKNISAMTQDAHRSNKFSQ